jgi:hypothetical protein
MKDKKTRAAEAQGEGETFEGKPRRRFAAVEHQIRRSMQRATPLQSYSCFCRALHSLLAIHMQGGDRRDGPTPYSSLQSLPGIDGWLAMNQRDPCPQTSYSLKLNSQPHACRGIARRNDAEASFLQRPSRPCETEKMEYFSLAT